jgi:arylsulfatase
MARHAANRKRRHRAIRRLTARPRLRPVLWLLDAETDQFAPELVSDNTHIDPPGTYASGYHLTSDLVDQSIRFIADHIADRPDLPWLTWLALGACHAPHQAPADIIKGYDEFFAHGWDVEREQRMARQKAMGIVPPETKMPARNDGVKAWDEHSADEKRVFTRLQSAFAGMLDHADRHLARLIAFLETAGVRDNTLILVLSDNGASQEGGPLGLVNAMGPYNRRPEPMPEKLRRLDDIGGPDSHTNFPHGWAMASNTPLRRYKQNTHGGGIRDPFVISWPKRIAKGELRHQFVHASDLTPTLLELVGVSAPAEIAEIAQMPIEGESFARSIVDASVPSKSSPQYFEMFGHRGLWHRGWKAVAYHPPGTPFENDKWELFHLEKDFSEVDDLAAKQPERLADMIKIWWSEAEKHHVLPLDDRFGARFAENAARFQGARSNFTFHAGMGHVPTDVAPDVRSRNYTIEAHVELEDAGAEGVLIAHGDATSGYSLYLKNGHLVHDLNIGGGHEVVTSDRKVPAGAHRLGVHVERLVRTEPPAKGARTGVTAYTLLIDGEPVGSLQTQLGFHTLISWSGLDIGRDRGSPVSHYEAPFEFTGRLKRVTVAMHNDQKLDGEGVGNAEMARQ